MRGTGGDRGSVRGLASAAFLCLLLVLLVEACGGGDGEEEAASPPPATTPGVAQGGGTSAAGGATTPAGANTTGGATVEANAQRETLEDSPFVLNLDQPVPADFRAAYQRQALIVVEFYKQGQDPFYPQGMEVDQYVNEDLTSLQPEYEQVEFFTYDIANPGTAETSEELGRGQYGTLAAQLEVGFTPFVAMMAPRLEGGEGYRIESLFQGYSERGVLDQALFDLTNNPAGGETSDVDLALGGVELTESGGGIEYFTVTNRGDSPVALDGFSVRSMDPTTAEISPGEGGGVEVTETFSLGPGQTASVGRAPDLVDADGRAVVGTFQGGEALALVPGDQLALLDPDGAVADVASV